MTYKEKLFKMNDFDLARLLVYADKDEDDYTVWSNELDFSWYQSEDGAIIHTAALLRTDVDDEVDYDVENEMYNLYWKGVRDYENQY